MKTVWGVKLWGIKIRVKEGEITLIWVSEKFELLWFELSRFYCIFVYFLVYAWPHVNQHIVSHVLSVKKIWFDENGMDHENHMETCIFKRFNSVPLSATTVLCIGNIIRFYLGPHKLTLLGLQFLFPTGVSLNPSPEILESFSKMWSQGAFTKMLHMQASRCHLTSKITSPVHILTAYFDLPYPCNMATDL